MLKDVRLHMYDRSFFHFTECDIIYYPNNSNPTVVKVTCKYFSIDLPFYSIECITPNWSISALDNP